ncbi:7_t:CDS:2, partial [Acaulospora colombiana]
LLEVDEAFMPRDHSDDEIIISRSGCVLCLRSMGICHTIPSAAVLPEARNSMDTLGLPPYPDTDDTILLTWEDRYESLKRLVEGVPRSYICTRYGQEVSSIRITRNLPYM